MIWLRSALFALVFYAGTVVAVLVAFPITALGASAIRRHTDRWARFHSWCARRLLGITARVEGVLPAAPALVAAKHQSAFETLELLVLLGDPAVVVKRELARIPLWGWVARRYGVIPIDRGGSAGAMRAMLRDAARAVDEGRMLVIFPEGTRVAPGETPPLRAGFAGLYRQLGLPVVPVAIDSGRLWPRASFLKRPGVVTFRFGDPIPPGLPRREAEALVHAAINALERPSPA